MVRDNTNLLIIFKQDDRNLRHIFDDHVNTDMLYERFKIICNKALKCENGFLLTDKERDNINNGRYRIGFEKIVTKI